MAAAFDSPPHIFQVILQCPPTARKEARMLHNILLIALAGSAIGCTSVDSDANSKPGITITSPNRSAWLAPGDTPVSGHAQRLRNVTVNGVEAALDGPSNPGDNFSAKVTLKRGINLIEARGTEDDGSVHYARHGVLAGKFGIVEDAVAQGVHIRLNRGGLQAVMGAAGALIVEDEVATAVSDMNPIYSGVYEVTEESAITFDASVTDLQFDTPILRATPTSHKLIFEADFPNFYVEVFIEGDAFGFSADGSMTMWASNVLLTGDLLLSATDGKVKADFTDATVDLIGFGYDTSLLSDGIDGEFLIDSLRAVLETKVRETMLERVPPMLDEQLAGLATTTSTEILGFPIDIAAAIETVDVDSDGVFASTALTVRVGGITAKEYPGVFWIDWAEPSPSRSADVGLADSDNLMNRVLFEAWRAGALDQTLSTDDDSLPAATLIPFKATEGTFVIEALLPPVFLEEDGQLQAQVGEFNIDISTPDGKLGQHLLVSAFVWADASLVVEDGVMHPVLSEPRITLAVRDSDWGASNEAITEMLTTMLQLETLLPLVSNIDYPLPTFGTLRMDSAAVGRDPNGTHTNASIEFGP